MAIDRGGAATSRLTVDDWVKAGFEILAEEGITALKIDRLCSRLDVTKGSFYWHFSDIAGYRATLIEAWGELRDDDRSHFADMSSIPPRERLSQMMSSLLGARHWTLERAMREWARTDDAVAASVRAADQRVIDAVRQAFVDHGFDTRTPICGPTPRSPRVSGSSICPGRRRMPEGLGPPGAIPRPDADALTRFPYQKVWYVRGHDRGPGVPLSRRISAQSSSPAWPSAPRKPRNCGGCPAPPSTSTSRRGCRNCSYPPATAACRRRGRRFSTRSAGWPTDARPAPGRSASTPCTTG